MPRSLHPEGRSDTLQDILWVRKTSCKGSSTRGMSQLTVENHLMRRFVFLRGVYKNPIPSRLLWIIRRKLFENSGKTPRLSNKRLLSIQLFQTAAIHHRTFVIVHDEACWICQYLNTSVNRLLMICIRMRFKCADVKPKFESQRKLIDCRRLRTIHAGGFRVIIRRTNTDWCETKFSVLKNSWQSRFPSIRCLLTVCLAFLTFLNYI